MTTNTTHISGDEARARVLPSLDASQQPDASLSIHEQIREYYGRILAGSDDLKTNAACCTTDAPPKYVRDVMPDIADEIMTRFYGCGSPIPPALEGCTVVDLGCGVGRDVYILSKLVGPTGRVIGVDMTESQLEVARKYQDEQAARFGFEASNVEFKCGYIEDLAELGIEDCTVDLVVSNCVINLTPFKEQVFAEIYRVLKPGGELYFSDVFCDRRIPEELRNDPVLRGECLGGALYIDDFRRMMARQGWQDYLCTVVDDIHVSDLALETKLGFMSFTSRTVRAIKATGLEDRHENYGQIARYKGTIPEMPRYFDLTDEIRLIKGRDVAISGNMAEMLAQSRYGTHFDIKPRGVHRGAFDFARAQDALAARRGKKAVDLAYLEDALSRIDAPSFFDRVNAPQALTAPQGATTMQLNITYQCNLACRHCYLECSPKNDEFMSREVMQACLDGFVAGGFKIMDITGGSAELHPDLPWLLRESSRVAEKVILRSNLTLYDDPQFETLLDVYAETGVCITASLPYFDSSTTDAQRGKGVFERAMRAIKKLNARGFGIASAQVVEGETGTLGALAGLTGSDKSTRTAEGINAGQQAAHASTNVQANASCMPRHLQLDLVYNVSGPFLPPPQDLLGDLYRAELKEREGIEFDELFAFNNYPLGRFAHDLLDANMFDTYLKLLVENFNALAVQRMMCRDQVNVDVDGRLYDCEVNHVLGLPIQVCEENGCFVTPGQEGAYPLVTSQQKHAAASHVASSPAQTRDATVFDLLGGPLPERTIRTHPVCYSCSAGFGSSCGGSLVSEYSAQ